jgi:hypothetical protein
MEVFMRRKKSGMVLALVLFILGVGLFFPPPASPQEKTDAQKISADVAGTYEFSYEGQAMTLIFFIKDGVLYGKEQMDPEEVEIKTLDLENLRFEATVQSSGRYYEIEFIRDEGGKVAKCHLKTEGIEVTGERVK